MVDAAHFIGLVAGKAIPSPVPYADVVTFTTHKVLRGPRGGAFVCKAEHAKAHRQGGLPDDAGRPADARRRGQGGRPQGGLQPEYQAYARQVIANAQALTEGLAAEGLRPVAGGTDTHLALLDLREIGVTGRTPRRAATPRGIVLNKNAIPYDPQPAVDRLRHPRRHPGGHHAGHGRGRHEGDRLAHRRRRSATPTAAARPRWPPGSATLVGAHPAYPEPRAAAALIRVREYAVVLLTAALVTFLATPVVRMARHPAADDGRPRGTGTCTSSRPRGAAASPCTWGWPRRSWSPPSCRSLHRTFDDSQTVGVLVAGGRDLPARRARRPLGPRRAHQAGRPDRRGRRDGALRRPAAVPVPAGRRHRHADPRAVGRRAR